MKKWCFFFSLYIVFHGFTSCNSTPEKPAKASSPQSTQISWQSSELELGKVPMGDTLHFSFVFTNSGDSPVIITEADGGCSCLQVVGPSQPVMPGKIDSIRVSFNTNLSVTGWVRKNIRVIANTAPGTHRLLFSAEITGHKK
jgi:hypothetical protein